MKRKPLRFDFFLKQFLYGPTGYYTGSSFKSGFDFVTAPQISSAFVKFVCAIAFRYASELLKDTDWSFVELGAGDGEVSSFFAATNPSRRVYAVEIAGKRRKRLLEMAKNLKNLVPTKSVEDLPGGLNAILFANEFFDALPVRVFKKTAGLPQELYFDQTTNRFFFGPVEDRIPEVVIKFLKDIPEGTVFEYESDLERIFQVFSNLGKTALFVIDYGFKIEEIERFRNGTLVGFFSHRFVNEPFEAFKLSSIFDVTHQVNFSFLSETARQHGFEETSYTSLGRFILENFNIVEADLSKEEKRELLRISLPHNFGDTFKAKVFFRKNSHPQT